MVETAGRVGAQNDAAEHKQLAADEYVAAADVVVDLQADHCSLLTTQLDLHGPQLSVLKPADLEYGGPELWI